MYIYRSSKGPGVGRERIGELSFPASKIRYGTWEIGMRMNMTCFLNLPRLLGVMLRVQQL